MELLVRQEKDKVLLITESRNKDILLTPLNAVRLADKLMELVNQLGLVKPELIRGEVWEINVTVFDKMVALRIIAPIAIDKLIIPLPEYAVRWLASKLYENAQWAGYGIRLVVN
jgi:hypothetical protein